MNYTNAHQELNKVIGGLSSWFPSQLYLAYCSGTSPISRVNGRSSFNIDNEFDISGYSRIPLTASLWNVQYKNGYADISTATYNALLTVGPFSSNVNLFNYFITDSNIPGSGFIINHGSINQSLTAGNTASLSGLNIRFSNGGGVSVPDAGIQYRGVLTSSGVANIQRHYLGIQPLGAGALSIKWLQPNASGEWGSNITSLTNLLSNDSGGYIYSTGVIYHSFTGLPSPTGYIGTAGVNIGSTRYMNLTPTDAGDAAFGRYVNEVNACSTWFSSTMQAHNGIPQTVIFSFSNL